METDRRQLSETESKIFRTGFTIHGRGLVDRESGSPGSVGETIPKTLPSTYTQTKTGFNNTARKSSNVLNWKCLERGWKNWIMCVHSKIQHPKPRSSSSVPSHLSALIVSRPRIPELQWHYRSYISTKFSLMMKTLPESWPPHVELRNSATVQRPNHTLTSWASESKTSNTYGKRTEGCKV